MSHVQSGSSGAFTKAIDKYPYFVTLVPELLDRGDPTGRELAFQLAQGVGSPEMLDALHDFAFSQRGPDKMRFKALTYLKQKGRLDAGPHRTYRDGNWTEIELVGFEITDEPTAPINPRTVDLQREGYDAMFSGDATRAERIFRQCVEIDADDPSTLHNLAASILQQRGERDDEAVQLLREIHERFPDYFFARTSLAQIAIRNNDLERAIALIRPLHDRQRMHLSEAMALMTVSIEIALARDDFEGAENMLESIKQWDSSDPRILQLRRKIDHARQPISLSNALKSLASGLTRR